MLNFIEGGVCAAKGFRAGGIHVGVKTHAEWKKDMAMIVSDVDCACAAVYTKNAVKAAHIHVDKAHVMVGGTLVADGDATLVDKINARGFSEFEKQEG